MVPCRWEERPQVWEEVLVARRWFETHARILRSSSPELVGRARATMIDQVFEDHSQPRRAV